MPKLTDKQKKKIIADFVDNGNKSLTARINKVDEKTVRKILEADNELQEKTELKKEQNTREVLEYFDSLKSDRQEVIKLSLEAMKRILPDAKNIRDVATAYGITLDKELQYLESLKENNNMSSAQPIIIVNDLKDVDNGD